MDKIRKRLLVGLVVGILLLVSYPVEAVVRPPVVPEYLRLDDPHTVRVLEQQGMDVRYIELEEDYNLDHPYGRIYKDKLTGKRIYEVGGLPMVDTLGVKIVPQWEEITAGSKYKSKTNVFHAEVNPLSNNRIVYHVKNNQPDGRAKGNTVTFKPQLFLNGIEIEPISLVLLSIDPVNPNYSNNVLEWNYGIVIRRLRIIEGSILGSWVFSVNPDGEVRIKYNQSGSYRLDLGHYSISNDEEVITATEFARVEYPFEVSDSATFYPDADPETSSVDGYVGRGASYNSWAAIRNGSGTSSNSNNDNETIVKINADTSLWLRLYRGIFLFDTSGLPDDANISAATLSIYGYYKIDQLGITPNVAIYSSNPASNTVLWSGDYTSLGTTAFSNTISYAAYDNSGWNDFALNASGIAAISNTGVSKFGTRNAQYDAGNVEPGGAGTDDYSNLSSYMAEKGTGYKPKLVVTYTLPAPIVTTSAATSVEETTATVNGEVTALNDTSITERGFVWDTVTHGDPGNVAPGSSDYANNWTEVGSWGVGVFNHSLTGLTKGELYYVRAAAENNDGNWGYGSEITFLTKPDAPNTLVATAGDEQVGLSWTKGTGADNTIIRGKIDGYPANYDTDVDVYSGTGSSITHTGLTNGDHWYYRAWSYVTEGGKEKYSDLYDQADATPVGTPGVTTNSATDIGFTDATLNGEVTAIGDTTITDRGFVWGTTSYGDPGNVAPGSTSYTSNWTESGSFGVGSFNHDITGLSEGQTYYFRAAAKNSEGWSYGNELSFQVVGLRLWFQPNTMINPANVPDRSGWGNTGTINWGTNPGGFEITIEGLKPFGSYVAPEQEEAPEVILLPTELEMFEPEAPDLSHLPVYDLVHQYSESLGWTDQVGYGVLMMITAIAFGFGAMVATGSPIGFAIGFGITAAAAGGTEALPWWIALICVLFAIFAAYAWRHT